MGLNQQMYDLGLPLIDLYKLDAIKGLIFWDYDIWRLSIPLIMKKS